ncbi:MAG TPA: SDR family oxidoreductase [Terracidiphilus sp.]|nr:SDR family oxidoreductase [Terracidiphilus sp.]
MAYISPLHGKWALVTGASSGIGAALARELAGRGAKLILTARRRDRLEALGQELAAEGTETRIIIADLNDPVAPHQIYRVTERAGLEVEILVNNAGLGQYGAFHANEIEQEMSQVRVNCDAVVRLSRLFVPRMVERKRGWVLVVASTASFQPMPYFATYAASKAFDRFFALGLAEEVAQYGVKVTALCPGPTESEFFDVARAGIFNRKAQPVDQVARQGIDGLEQGQRTVIPNSRGWFGAHIVRLLPTSLVTRQIAKMARPKASQSSSDSSQS